MTEERRTSRQNPKYLYSKPKTSHFFLLPINSGKQEQTQRTLRAQTLDSPRVRNRRRAYHLWGSRGERSGQVYRSREVEEECSVSRAQTSCRKEGVQGVGRGSFQGQSSGGFKIVSFLCSSARGSTRLTHLLLLFCVVVMFRRWRTVWSLVNKLSLREIFIETWFNLWQNVTFSRWN